MIWHRGHRRQRRPPQRPAARPAGFCGQSPRLLWAKAFRSLYMVLLGCLLITFVLFGAARACAACSPARRHRLESRRSELTGAARNCRSRRFRRARCRRQRIIHRSGRRDRRPHGRQRCGQDHAVQPHRGARANRAAGDDRVLMAVRSPAWRRYTSCRSSASHGPSRSCDPFSRPDSGGKRRDRSAVRRARSKAASPAASGARVRDRAKPWVLPRLKRAGVAPRR